MDIKSHHSSPNFWHIFIWFWCNIRYHEIWRFVLLYLPYHCWFNHVGICNSNLRKGKIMNSFGFAEEFFTLNTVRGILDIIFLHSPQNYWWLSHRIFLAKEICPFHSLCIDLVGKSLHWWRVWAQSIFFLERLLRIFYKGGTNLLPISPDLARCCYKDALKFLASPKEGCTIYCGIVASFANLLQNSWSKWVLGKIAAAALSYI